VTVTVDVRGIEEIDTEVERAMQRREAFVIVDFAPGAADGPAAHADGGNIESSPPQESILHAGTLQRRPPKSKRAAAVTLGAIPTSG
jgi:hypothetical protein